MWTLWQLAHRAFIKSIYHFLSHPQQSFIGIGSWKLSDSGLVLCLMSCDQDAIVLPKLGFIVFCRNRLLTFSNLYAICKFYIEHVYHLSPELFKLYFCITAFDGKVKPKAARIMLQRCTRVVVTVFTHCVILSCLLIPASWKTMLTVFRLIDSDHLIAFLFIFSCIFTKKTMHLSRN